MGKSGQLDVVIFLIMVIVLLIAAPVCMKFFHSVMMPLGNAIAPMSPQANTTVGYLTTSYDTFWDFAVLMMFIALVATLFLSSFLVNMHPAFLILYIILAFVMVIITPMLASSATSVANQLAADTAGHLPYTDYLRSNIVIITLAVLILSGIISYGKMRLGGVQAA